ncbi:MAG: hypothetical protein GY832_11660 [Chloroflexi bacterium]|nr:hypothetical protein [Chloroflexota bacterium]
MDKQVNEHRECYRRCFSTPDGRKVLSNMLMDMGFFDQTVGDSAVRDYAAGIVRTLGIAETPGEVEQLVEKMFEVTPCE